MDLTTLTDDEIKEKLATYTDEQIVKQIDYENTELKRMETELVSLKAEQSQKMLEAGQIKNSKNSRLQGIPVKQTSTKSALISYLPWKQTWAQKNAKHVQAAADTLRRTIYQKYNKEIAVKEQDIINVTEVLQFVRREKQFREGSYTYTGSKNPSIVEAYNYLRDVKLPDGSLKYVFREGNRKRLDNAALFYSNFQYYHNGKPRNIGMHDWINIMNALKKQEADRLNPPPPTPSWRNYATGPGYGGARKKKQSKRASKASRRKLSTRRHR